MGGIRSIFDLQVHNAYDDKITRARYQEVNQEFRKRIESNLEALKKKY